MKPFLMQRSLLVCVLELFACCTAAASEKYINIRVMWVSTTGEDSRQCIHDTQASDPSPHPRYPNESCGSLNYALKHIQNGTTIIIITCGIHVLEPVGSSSDNTLLSNVTHVEIWGNCANGIPQIQCTDGTNLVFYNVELVKVMLLSFHDCGVQLQHSDSLLDSSTLYFQDCKTVVIEHINITISGPYGRGISFIRNDTTISHGNVIMAVVKIYHFGIHGSGMYFEVLTGRARDDATASENIQLKETYVESLNVFPSYNCTRTFTGINITVMGDGEGGEITLSKITVKRTTRGSSISIAVLDSVQSFHIQFNEIAISDKRNNFDSNDNMTDSGITSHEQFSDVSENVADNVKTTLYSSISIVLRDNSMANYVEMRNVAVKQGVTVGSGSAFSIEITNQSEGNDILLQEVYLAGSNSSGAPSRGLQVIVTGWARRNEIQVTSLHTWRHRASWGAGAYIEFSGHTTENLVSLRTSLFFDNHALNGGGVACVCKDFATENTFKVLQSLSVYNHANFGGGVYVILRDSSNKNTIDFKEIRISNNTAYCGGGMFIQIQDTSTTSTVVVLQGFFMNNTLLTSEEHDRMGGGVHVEFSTVIATFTTDNTAVFTMCQFLLNTAGQGVGGAISVLYKHSHYQGDSGDIVFIDRVVLFHNMAASGSACAFQSLPTHGKKLFKGIRIKDFSAVLTTSEFQAMSVDDLERKINHQRDFYFVDLIKLFISHMQEQLSQTINPSFQVQTNTNMMFTKSVQIIVFGELAIICGASSQGIYALDSEIVFEATVSTLQYCVATHGGAIALYGESNIKVGKNALLQLSLNLAFQRGGAIYVNSPHGVVPVSNCFLQHDQEWEEHKGTVMFYGNNAKGEGNSVFVSDIRSCFSGSTLKNLFTTLTLYPEVFLVNGSFARKVNFLFIYKNVCDKECDGHNRYELPLNISQFRSCQCVLKTVQSGMAFGPSHVAGGTVDLNKPLTVHFIPGKQKSLPYSHAYDDVGSNITSVFTVLINKMDDTILVELNPFSKYTADFTVILHGIPQQHGMANHSFLSNTSNTSAVVKPPQLVLQSVDNKDLLLVMDIELQCCPPGYIYRYGSGDMGTCHCGMTTVIGIAECNETHPEVIGAVLERDHWAGYLPSNDRHSCDIQKFFTGPCPPGYCQTQRITLPQNNSQQELQGVVCAGSNRKGLLCGDCLEGKGIAVNFNGIRPVCASCEEWISKVGILVWILSEWVPMLAFMFTLMLFNIDLVSGRFNSYLLFAQLLAFSTIRSDAELGPVHNAFVKIYRFLYGMWNLDFVGVLLPPYCLAPHAHLTLLQTLLLQYSIGLFPLTVAITLTVLERSAEKWICCHRVDKCLRRMRRWKGKYSDGMSYDRALPAFVILGFTRFLVSSFYILVNQTITGEDGERKVVMWWQGSVPYGSIQHIAYFIPASVILLVFVFLPSFLLLTLPIGPQLFGRLILAMPPLRKLQWMQTFCSNVYTDRWVYHFVNVFQGCYKEHYRSFSSLYLFHRIVHLLVAVFVPRAEDALRIQIILIVALLLLIATCQPYNTHQLNTLDAAILGNLALILILNLYVTDLATPIRVRHFYASLQMILIYLALLYPGTLLGKKVYLKCRQLRCCQKQEEQREDNAETPLEAPAERLGNLVLITELRAGVPTSENDDTMTETETET